jgi:hypothetical protein
MPNTCPYRGCHHHANGHYLTPQHHARYLTLEEREIEYNHNNAGCDDLCKGKLSSAGIAMCQAITQVVLGEFENAGPLYTPHSPSPDYDYTPVTTRGQISAWKHSFEGRVVISSISGTERGEVFYGPTDWLRSRDPLTPYDTRVAHNSDWLTETAYYTNDQ